MSWARGQSGNPRGRPKGTGHLQRIRRHRGEFVQALRDGLKSDDPRERVECIKLGLAYSFGKPPEAPEEKPAEPVDDSIEMEPMSEAELREAEQLLALEAKQ